MTVRRFELLGVPGAGKSTLIRGWDVQSGVWSVAGLRRRERLAGTGHRRPTAAVRLLPTVAKERLLRGREPEPKDAAFFLAANPQLHRLVLDVSDGVAVESDRLLALAMLMETWGWYGYADRVGRPGEGILMDEGGWQRLAFLRALAGRSADGLPLLPARLPSITGIVVLELPRDVAATRISTRRKGWARHELVPAMAAITGAIAEELGDAGVATLRLDATQPVEALRAAVREFVARH